DVRGLGRHGSGQARPGERERGHHEGHEDGAPGARGEGLEHVQPLERGKSGRNVRILPVPRERFHRVSYDGTAPRWRRPGSPTRRGAPRTTRAPAIAGALWLLSVRGR